MDRRAESAGLLAEVHRVNGDKLQMLPATARTQGVGHTQIGPHFCLGAL